VCSDETVVDSIVVSANELGDVTTNPVGSPTSYASQDRAVFATYQSSPEIAKAFELGGVAPFDLVVADELSHYRPQHIRLRLSSTTRRSWRSVGCS
jgi:predicted helicase